jgi:hypothetical protein
MHVVQVSIVRLISRVDDAKLRANGTTVVESQVECPRRAGTALPRYEWAPRDVRSSGFTVTRGLGWGDRSRHEHRTRGPVKNPPQGGSQSPTPEASVLAPPAHHEEVGLDCPVQDRVFRHSDLYAALDRLESRTFCGGAEVVQGGVGALPVQAHHLGLEGSAGHFTPQRSESLDGGPLDDSNVDD